MSCYEWESGSIKLPSAEAVRFRKDLSSGINDLNDRLISKVNQMIDSWKKLKKKRNPNYSLQEQFFKYIDSLNSTDFYRVQYIIKFDSRDMPLKVKKKDLAYQKQSLIDLLGCDWRMIVKGTQVRWSVEENNHAVADAHSDSSVRLLFRLLTRVKWTKRSGGVICGNDEYNKDSLEFGGGANYINRRFGGIGDRA